MSEATSIDKLSIEITSNSSGAAEGIGKLATELGKLKSNGSIGVACKNLERLSDALKKLTPVTSNASKLSALAESITKLSGAGSIASVVNQLSKLPGALRGLSGLNIDNNLGNELEELARAMAPLSQVKAGGIGTIANGLTKLQNIDLSKIKFDDEAVAGFVAEIKKLDNAIGPLSTKMIAVGNTFNQVNASARTAKSGVSAFDGTVKTSTLNLANFITVVQGAISALMPVVRLFSRAIGDAMEWDGISYQFGNAFGEQADEYYQKITEITDVMQINKQTFMEMSAMSSSMLIGFGVGAEDARKMGVGYTELAYDIWAAYNNVYKTFDGADGAMAAVRSAISGEVEPIRRAGFTIVDSQLKITAANHGIAYSSEKATEAQKSYLRYLTLVDQATSKGIIGAYANEMDTAEGLTRTLTQQLKSLSQAFGSLFLPILVKIMPWLQAFVSLLTDAITLLAGFFGITIQPVDWGGYDGGSSTLNGLGDAADTATESLGNVGDSASAAKDAVEDLKKATIGIDELNVISPPVERSSGGSGGDGGGNPWDDLDIESLWDESIFNQIQSRVDEIKQKFKDWLPILGTIGGALSGLGIANLLTHMGEALEKMNLLQKAFSTVATVAIEAALVFIFTDNYLETGNLLYLVGEALVTAAAGYLLFKAWGPGGAVLALGVSVLAQLVALEMSLADGTVSLTSKETWIQGITTILTGALGGAIIATKTGFFAKEGFVIGLGVSLALTMIAINMGAIESGEIDTGSFESWIMQAISVAGAGMSGFQVGKALSGTAAGGRTGLLIGVTVGLVLNLASIIGAKGEDFGDNFSDWLNTAITAVMTGFTAMRIWNLISPYVTPALSGLLPKIGAALSGAFTTGWSAITSALSAIPVWGWIVAAVVTLLSLAIVDYDFSEIGRKIGKALGKACGTVVNFAADIGGTIWKGLKTALNWVKENITWDDVKRLVAALFKKETWTEIILPKVKDIGLQIWNGIWGGIRDGAKNLWGNITEFVKGFIQGFKDGFQIKSPSKKMVKIGEEILAGLLEPLTPTALKDTLKKMWDKAKKWWDGTTGLEKIKIAVSLFKSGWKTVSGWIGKIPGVSQAVKLAKSGWKSVKGWIGTIPAVAQGIKLAKSGWKSLKGWIGTIPILSQGIKLFKSDWKSVKGWIGTIPAVSQAVKLAKSGWKSVSGWIGTMPTLSAGIKLAKSGWTSLKSWLGIEDFKLKFKLPSIGINWGEKTVAGFKITYPKGFYTYAKGGFPDVGEMFIAREAGPEMVGKIGSKTTVANNDQIVEGISEGVYAAVLAAMRQSEGSGTQAVNVYLDGRQITSSVEKRQHERGAALMGKQVYAY